VRLRAEVEDVRLVGRLEQFPNEVVDRRLVREVGEVHLDVLAQAADVVQCAARRRAHEGVDVRIEVDQRLRQVGAHEAVGAGDETRPTREELAVVVAQFGERVVRPGGVT
jgi:hypothetical protein